jgi:hypothetical protein
MATHGGGGVARFALGSVATVTLHHASVPLLLLVRPAEVRKPEAASTPAGVTA